MKNLYFINLKGGKILLTVIFFIAALTIYSNATILVYIGSSDGSPYHVPYQGIVNIPVWIDDIGSGTYALIDLVTLDSVVSERLGGNFYYPWWYEFSDPFQLPYRTFQRLSFIPLESLDSLSQLADFTFMMDIDTSFVADTLSIMFANAVFSDSLGQFLFDYQMNVSEVVIDDVTSVENENINPENMFISLAYPNPFNATVTVRYSLPEESDVEIVIYDIRGRVVKTIYKEGVSAGENSIIWEGTGESGEKIASGIYLYRITAGGYEATSRMTLLK
jgi:flagellar hook assembly protein FlgD